MEGSRINLQCSADCNPRCGLNWYREDERLATRNGLISYPVAKKYMAGNYTCKASNGIGASASSSVLIVIGGMYY